jgi:hypothetical protein
MARRQFTDVNAVTWDVYDVVSVPGLGRPGEPQIAPHSEVFRAARSWLVFESAGEKRRLSYIPDNWEDAAQGELQRLLDQTVPMSKRST